MKIRKIVQATIFFLLLSGMLCFTGQVKKARAYTADEKGSPDKIGQFSKTVGSYSYVGFKIYWENELLYYAFDTYKKVEEGVASSAWHYVLTNVNGECNYFTTNFYPTSSPVSVQVNGMRFVIDLDMIRNGRTDHSTLIEVWSENKKTNTYLEIPDVPSGQYGTNMITGLSCLPSVSKISVGSSARGNSYFYHFYDVRRLQADGKIKANAQGGSISSAGKAYCNGSGCVLTKLPTASYQKSGYSCSFLGWFNAASGGTQHAVGNTLKDGNVLYAHWNITPNQYDVTCIDILGDDPKGKVLGKKTWKAACDAQVNAETAGTDKTTGAYYNHCRYMGATRATVTPQGATVYRYFSYENYPVTYVDKIESGTREGEELNTTSDQAPYATAISGATLGEDTTAGAYYKGYCYSRCTKATVGDKGTTVYRYFRPVQYQILFHGNGATDGAMEALACQYDKSVSLPKNVFRKISQIKLYQSSEKLSGETVELTVAHKFLGWATQENGIIKYADAESLKNITDQEGEVSLYAVWSEESVTPPNVPSRIGYHFLGWAKTPDASGGMSQITVTGSQELYAVWKEDIVKYHVEYYKENLDGGYDLTSSYGFEGYTNKEVSLDSVDKIYPGFALDKASSKLSGKIKADGSLILCAYFRRIPYGLKYDLNGGSLTASESGSLKAGNVVFGKSLTLPSVQPARKGYLFEGWSQEPDEITNLYQPGDSFVMQNHDTVLYAQWKKIVIKVKYDKNAAYSKVPGITGNVPDTEYIYQKDSYASEKIFEAGTAKMVAWNSKPDGSGISVRPGTNMKGLFDSCQELVLYAIWEHDTTGMALFQIKVLKENGGQTQQIDLLKLQGKAGEKIRDALLRIYQDELQGEDAIYFYKGHEVVDAAILEQMVSLNSDTEISLTVKERKCSVSYNFGENAADPENKPAGITTDYQGKTTLPEKLPNGEEIERFEDSRGNAYFPGDTISLERNLTLTVQHSVYLHDVSEKEKEQVFYVARGDDFIFPECKRTGYRFLGWYSVLGTKEGEPGDAVKNITKRFDFYAKWSEPLTYYISYDMGGADIQILENHVSYYQYSKGAVLPTASQVVVPDGYQFAGWYYSDDAEKKVIAEISATEYGDKTLKPLLAKKDSQGEDNKEEGNKPGDNTPEGNRPGTDKPGDNTPEGNRPGADKPGDNTPEGDRPGADKPGDNTPGDGSEDKNNGQQASQKPNTPSSGDKDDSTKPGQENRPPTLDREDTGDKKVPSIKKEKVKAGIVFWKENLKYKVISCNGKKAYVKVVGNKWKKAKLSIPKRVMYGQKVFYVSEIGKKAFYRTKKITTAVISDSVKKIGTKAFYNMKKLKKVTIGKQVKQIGKDAFCKNPKLKKIVIKSKKICKIGTKAFYQIHKKANFQIAKGKKKAYQKLLKTSKLKKTVHIQAA